MHGIQIEAVLVDHESITCFICEKISKEEVTHCESSPESHFVLDKVTPVWNAQWAFLHRKNVG